jgi:hypothetical protein
MPDYSVCDYGAVGGGDTRDTSAIQAAVDACAAAGGGRVVVPAGLTCLSGSIDLKSHVDFHLEPGSRVVAGTEREDYVRPGRTRACLIGARDAVDVSITGSGEIDGRGPAFMAEEGPYIFVKRENGWRHTMFLLEGCCDVTFRDVTIRDGAAWTVHLAGCRDVVMHGVRIKNNLKVPNNDAVDLDCCTNVTISDCHIESADDCICLKTTPRYAEQHGACENITVTGCTLMSTSGALMIGCEAKAPMRNVVFDSCIVRSSHRGLAIHLSHESDVENVLFSNMVVETRVFHPKWWGRGEPIYVTAIPWTADDAVGRVRHVRFSNVLCRSENGVFIQGWTPDRIEDLVLDNVQVEIDKWSRWPAGQHDIRPCPADPGGPGPVGEGVYDYPTAGFFIKNATDVSLCNCRVRWGTRRQDCWRHALEAHAVDGLRLEGFDGQSAWPDRYDAIARD